MQSFCKVTIGGEIHYMAQVQWYPRAKLLPGKDSVWNARRESRKQQRARIASSHVPVAMPCSQIEERMVQRNVRLLGLDREYPVRDSGHRDAIAKLMQVCPFAARQKIAQRVKRMRKAAATLTPTAKAA